MAELRSVMGAAAVELDAHWAAHCDADGYGPVNLQRRLERGVAVEYPAFTAKGWAAQQAHIAELEAAERRQGLNLIHVSAEGAELEAEREKAQAHAAQLEAHVHTLREALEEVEWIPSEGDFMYCPWCEAEYNSWDAPIQHMASCKRARALAATEVKHD